MCIHRLRSISREETMDRKKLSNVYANIAILAMTLAPRFACAAQETAQEPARETTTQAPEQQRQKADGERRGLPLETYAVTPRTKFLVKLEDQLSTKGTPENGKFKVKTLEPLETGGGIYLPPGAEIRGQVSRVEPAGVGGRAELWVAFDENRTKFGKLPIVGGGVSAAGEHSAEDS